MSDDQQELDCDYSDLEDLWPTDDELAAMAKQPVRSEYLQGDGENPF